MINLLRKLRRHYAAENNIVQYLRYAFGEIALIIIGIIFALQLDNWNTSRKQNEQFNDLLQQLYNVINTDLQYRLTVADEIDNQLRMIDDFLNIPDSVAPEKMIHKLFYIDLYPTEDFKSEIKYYLSLMEYNPDNRRHVEIAKELTTYAENTLWDLGKYPTYSTEVLAPALTSNGIPRPPVVFGFSSYHDFREINSDFYSEEEIQECRALLSQEGFRAKLRTQYSIKSMALSVIQNSLEDARSILKLIRSHYPEVKLRYEDIGIIGTALESGWSKSVPMRQIKEDSCIWEIQIQLVAGFLKFRSRDSWSLNWGGKGFPTGSIIYFGEEIYLEEAGDYRILLNLENSTYQFQKLLR